MLSFSIPPIMGGSAVCEVLNIFTYEWPQFLCYNNFIFLCTPVKALTKVVNTYVTKIIAQTFTVSWVLSMYHGRYISERNISQLKYLVSLRDKQPPCCGIKWVWRK